MRLKVKINAHKPFQTEFWWANSGNKEKWVEIKYERLSDFYSGCERPGHSSMKPKSDAIN